MENSSDSAPPNPISLAAGPLSLRAPRWPLAVGEPQFRLSCQFAEWHFECVRNRPQPAHSRFDDPWLCPANVRLVEAAIGAQTFLRAACLLSQFHAQQRQWLSVEGRSVGWICFWRRSIGRSDGAALRRISHAIYPLFCEWPQAFRGSPVTGTRMLPIQFFLQPTRALVYCMTSLPRH
jgi:hypothetical protein